MSKGVPGLQNTRPGGGYYKMVQVGDVLGLRKCYQCGGETLGSVVKHSISRCPEKKVAVV